jgi:hypothetical protein
LKFRLQGDTSLTGSVGCIIRVELEILDLDRVVTVEEVVAMFQKNRWFSVPIAVALATTGVSPVLAQAIMMSPNAQPIQVSGMSGGSQKDKNCAGFIASAPNHLVQVTEDTDFRFVLQGSGQPALLIRSSTGQSFCVPADSYSQGKVEIARSQ